MFLLRYRLGPAYLFPVPLNDARRAVRLVRSLAQQYGYSPDRIGMMGFSAGGHLAAITSMLPLPGMPLDPDPVEHESSQVDFLILVYPWLNAMQPQVFSTGGLMINYCSVVPDLTQDVCRSLDSAYTPANHISLSSPPTILFASADDRIVPVETDVEFYRAMQKAGRDCELHLFAYGQHGFGLGGSNLQLSAWPLLLENWLRGRGLLGP